MLLFHPLGILSRPCTLGRVPVVLHIGLAVVGVSLHDVVTLSRTEGPFL